MVTKNERASYGVAGAHVNSLRRAVTGAVVAFPLLTAAASPAAAASQDGTSNTIQRTVTSTVLDQAQHRVLVTVPPADGLSVGRHLATAEVVTPRYTYILSSVLVESLADASASYALNYTGQTLRRLAPPLASPEWTRA